jgi:hypothetical protein
MALVFAMEVTEWCFFSSAPLFSSAFLVTVFAVVSVFAVRPVITARPVLTAGSVFAMISFTPVLVMPGFSRLLFGDTVDSFLLP